MEQTAEITELEEITKRLEYLTIKKMLNDLSGKVITEEQFSQIAKDFLAIEPFASLEDCKAKMATFCSTYTNYQMLLEYINSYHHEKKTDARIEEMRGHLKNNDFTNALKVAQQ